MSSGKFAVGDPCFAKVKGYIPYPAKILARIEKVKKEKYLVLFYGEQKTAPIEVGSLWPVTSASIKKLVTATSLSRKGFSDGYQEMKVEHDLPAEGVKTSSGGIGGADLPLANAEDDEFDEFEMDFFKSIGLARKKPCDARVKTNNDELGDIRHEEVSIEVQGVVEKAEEEADQIEEDEFECELGLAERVALAEGVDLLEKEVLQDGLVAAEETFDDVETEIDNVFEGEDLQGQDFIAVAAVQDSGALDKKKKKKGKDANPVKKSKVKKAAPRKRGKTLREDEMELNSLFAEKIVVQADESFHCKDCPGFVTSVRLLARTHAKSCGSKKMKPGRRPKRISCSDCGALCEGKKGLRRHFKTSHVITSYSCSKCLKTFKSRKYYAMHLKIHDEKTAEKCPFCPKTFRLKSYMRRHMKRAHRNILKPSTSIPVTKNDDDLGTEVNFEIEIQLEEAKIDQEHSWQLKVSFPASDKSRSRSHGSFFNTLGVYSKEDWEDWVKISKILSLPLSVSGHRDDFELAWSKDGNGKEEIVCIGTSSIPTLFEQEREDDDKEGEEQREDDVKEGDTAEPIDVSVAVIEIEDAVDARKDANEVEDNEEENDANDDMDGDIAGLNNEPVGVICPHCKEGGFKDAWFLKRHVQRMHLVPIKCEVCQTVFIDKYRYVNHSKDCFFTCPREGCTFKEKRRSRLEGHMRKHEREW